MPRIDGVVAAGHPLTAAAGAQVLREGGNAVDGALAALIASFATEPLLTGLGAGGYMLVAEPHGEPVLLDFFAQTPSLRLDGQAAPLDAVDVSFGDAVQTFNGGPASCAVPGMAAGIVAAAQRWASRPLEVLAAAGERLAREGVELNGPQAYVANILEGLLPRLRSAPKYGPPWEGPARGRTDPRARPRRLDRAARSPRRRAVLCRLGWLRRGRLGLRARRSANA